MDIHTALKVKWLGSETSEICKLLAKYQPLIHVSPAPRLTKELPDMMLLPVSVSLRWDLQLGNPIAVENEAEGQQGIHIEFDTINSIEDPNALAAIYEFYFEVYVKHTAFGLLQGTTIYGDIETLHEDLLTQRYFSFTRALINGEVVGGCLMGEFPIPESIFQEMQHNTGAAASDAKIAGIDFICADVRFKGANLARRILSETAEQARKAGFAYLQTQRMSPVTFVYDSYDLSWAFGSQLSTIAHEGYRSLLYCDLARCAYFSNDFFFYREDEGALSLHYVANVSPDASVLGALMRSVANVEKKIYTRLPRVERLASDLGVECVLL